MKEKPLITSFFAANMCDVGSTAVGLGMGFQEIGFAGSSQIEAGHVENAMITRIAVTAVLIGSYALAKNGHYRLEYPLEKSIQISNVIAWGVVLFNTAQILPYVWK